MTLVLAVAAIAVGCPGCTAQGFRPNTLDAGFDDGGQSIEVVRRTEDEAGTIRPDIDDRRLGEQRRNDTPLASGAVAGSWNRADNETVRLVADAFPDLSEDVVEDLNRRGCGIPQPWLAIEPVNVVYGRFTFPGQTDAAVLCSVERVSSILVYRGNSTDEVAALATVADRGYLQDVGGARIGFSRQIGVADAQRVRDRHASHGGPEPPRTDVDGIEDFFLAKASIIWYWHDGQWLQLAGSD